ncbi:MAG: hypothetical protein IH591_14830 [Bacteroidales bacterium]|nr:hypothetical protein [Bacteroidales bacterium]
MKRLFTVLAFLALGVSWAGAQIVTERCWHLDKVQFLEHRQDFWRGHKMFSTSARPLDMISGGFYNVTEGHYGYGLKIRDEPFSNHFAGVTTVAGWRFGNGLAVGGGVGFLSYNEGWLLPLYADGRYFIGRQKNKFFVMLSGGFLLNFEDFSEETNFFANPGVGIIIPLAKITQLSFGVGFWSQFDKDAFNDSGAGYRDSFINMKLGFVFGK